MTLILIADDSATLRAQLRVILESRPGWVVCGEAPNGQKAVLMTHELKPDLVILDLAMPMLDGFHAATEIVKIRPSVPIVIYTLHASPQMELEAAKCGVRAVVSKSQGQKVLIETVERLLASHAPSLALGDAGPQAVGLPLPLAAIVETKSEIHPMAAADPLPEAE